ncbi:MAG: dependent oxidoreductase [Frankiales bacterium]|nr:dependent oxidoreductase [Frankiales bacterium]
MILWQDQLPAQEPRAPLPGDTDADVCVVGAGYTGLWTALHLRRLDPTLRVVVVERDVAGAGASGRNGGWCSALFPTSWHRIARDAGREGVVAMQRALEDSVDEIGRSGIACDYAKGGSVALVRTPAQLARARADVAEARSWGFGPDTLDLVGAEQAQQRVAATRVLGALTTDHCAALHPAKLVRGLAAACVDAGVTLHEQTTAGEVRAGRVVTDHGTVTAEVVLTATEGYTAQLRGHRRDLAPVYSLMLATAPLPADLWQQIGLADRATFTDERHLTVYGQRTADGRLAFGGRGAPYHYASRVHPSYEQVPRVHDALEHTLLDLFPAVTGVPVTHRWGGNLGVPRDWYPSVGFDRTTGVAWAGGYVGDGVATANLAGRTLAHLITGVDSELVRLPWVRRRTKRWEPEPLRWIGVNAVTQLMSRADRVEARTGRPSRSAALFWRSLGH